MNDKKRECEVLDKQNSEPKYWVFTIVPTLLNSLIATYIFIKWKSLGIF
jgi:hypothetical protein